MPEPHKIKTVRPLFFPTLAERKQYLADAHFNVFDLTPHQGTFDMCSLGTSAMSQEQLAGQLIGDEAYAGSRNFETLEQAVHQVLGHTYVCPTHNVLGCVKLVVATLVPRGSVVPSKARTRLGTLKPRVGVEYPNVRDRAEAVFTGNVDLGLLEAALQGGNVSIVGLQAFADGQHPFSLRTCGTSGPSPTATEGGSSATARASSKTPSEPDLAGIVKQIYNGVLEAEAR